MYSEFYSDAKVQMMTEAMQRRLVMLLCLRCSEQNLKESEIAWCLRISLAELAETKVEFVKSGFIDGSWKILNWDKRQKPSDSSSERTQRYRDRREAAGLPRSSEHLADSSLYSRDGHRCIYCQSQEKLCIDHIYPISLGGCDEKDNLGVACKACNSGKSGRTPEQAGYKILNPDALSRYQRYVTVTGRGVTVAVTVQNRVEEKEEKKETIVRFTSNDCKRLYDAYPRREGWGAAEKKILIALKNIDDPTPVESLLKIVRHYAKCKEGTERQFIPLPATWFHQKRYLDNQKEWEKTR